MKSKEECCCSGTRNEYDVIITELGGTVGDIESLPFIEAVRQLQWELPEEDVVVIHLTLIPYLKAAKELKTKPTQHSVRMLSQEGVTPGCDCLQNRGTAFSGDPKKNSLVL